MRALKTALLISSAVLFSIACSTSETTSHNSNQSAPAAAATNANATPTAAAANTNPAPAGYASASPNTNQPTKAADKPAASATPASNVDGASLYTANKCATCHGVDGKGKIKDARDFTDAAWQNKESDADLVAAIRNGKKPMPPYGDKLNADEIRALVAYVRAFGKK